MDKLKNKPHRFNIGEGYGIWNDLDGSVCRNFPTVFYRAKNRDGAGEYKRGDAAAMYQPCSKATFGMFEIADVETGDFGGVNLRYRITVKPVGTPEAIEGRR